MTEPLAAGAPERPMVLVAVGTDHHPFDRLVEWVDRWLADGAADRADVLVQYGTSRAPERARGTRLLDHAALQSAMDQAAVVVCHGGPATIMEARRHGHLPVCVPRDPGLGEHVDNHQQRFARRMGEAAVVRLAEDEETWRRAVEETLVAGRANRPTADGSGPHAVPEGVARFADLVGDLLPAARSSADAVPVLYVGGLGRSGSTLLERAVAEVDGLVCVGEVVHLWDRGVRGDELCGCGRPFGQCDFWQQVGKVAFGGWHRVDVEQVLALKASVERTRYVPQLLRARPSPAYAGRLRRYGDLLTSLYRGILEVSGAELVVDASKEAALAMVLSRTPGVDLTVVHVVRDSPAVAHSWTRQIRRPEARDPDELMPAWSPSHTSLLWDVENGLLELLARRGVPTHLIRYEDFSADPEQSLRQLLAFLGRPADEPLPFLDGRTMHLDVSHTVAGNPMRFRTGSLEVVADHGWESSMPVRQRRLVAGLTAPLRRHYGYGRRTL